LNELLGVAVIATITSPPAAIRDLLEEQTWLDVYRVEAGLSTGTNAE